MDFKGLQEKSGDGEKFYLEMLEAEEKALEALAKCKFIKFGYWASVWTQLNNQCSKKKRSPWQKDGYYKERWK